MGKSTKPAAKKAAAKKKASKKVKPAGNAVNNTPPAALGVNLEGQAWERGESIPCTAATCK